MKKLVILTGANGHLGKTIAELLVKSGIQVRGLVLPNDPAPELEQLGIEIIRADIRHKEALEPLFDNIRGKTVSIIHTAAIIDIVSDDVSPQLWDVNVLGTENMIALALQNQVTKFIHISSVHALPELPGYRQIREVDMYSPDLVRGGYAKTKAAASDAIMHAIKYHKLPAIILLPSGIIGPGDAGANYLVATLLAYLNKKIRVCPPGGYNLVDSRDVAAATITALEKGRIGESYILSGQHYQLATIFAALHELTGGGPRFCPKIPMWILKMLAPAFERTARRKKRPPLITSYALSTLTSNDNFTHEKASKELDFWPRDLYQTLSDTIDWLNKNQKN